MFPNNLGLLLMQSPEIQKLLMQAKGPLVPESIRRGGLMNMGNMPRSVAPIQGLGGGMFEKVMGVLGQAGEQSNAQQQAAGQQQKLQGGGVHTMDVSGLLSPFVPPPVSYGGLFGGK